MIHPISTGQCSRIGEPGRRARRAPGAGCSEQPRRPMVLGGAGDRSDAAGRACGCGSWFARECRVTRGADGPRTGCSGGMLRMIRAGARVAARQPAGRSWGVYGIAAGATGRDGVRAICGRPAPTQSPASCSGSPSPARSAGRPYANFTSGITGSLRSCGSLALWGVRATDPGLLRARRGRWAPDRFGSPAARGGTLC